MKVLMVNKFFYIKGGSETYYFNLKKLLEDNGHEVIDFSMKDEKNLNSKYSEFFINNIDYNKKISILKKIMLGFKIIYSFEAKKKFEELINSSKPDIIHLNIFQSQISSSIIDVAKKYSIPIIYTAHDLKALCPNYKMMDNNIKIFEKCKHNNYFNCVKKRCIKKSFLKSLIGYFDAKFNQFKNTYNKFDYIITPSDFYKRKFIEYGYDKNKVIHIPNFIYPEMIHYTKNKNENYYLYFGRLSEEKGINTLINAAIKTNIKLYIVGTGPLFSELIKTNKSTNIYFLGFKSGKELYTLVANAKAVILPSEWYENGPYSAIESLYLSRPIIGSDLGGIPELINNNGYIYKHGNVNDLIDKINLFENLTSKDINILEQNSYKIYCNNHSNNSYYNKIMCIYSKAIKIHEEERKK